jgi:hypothetical protein
MQVINLIRSFVVVVCAFSANAIAAKVWSPYLMSDPDRIEHSEGYCKTPIEERKFWSAVNKFSGSFLSVAPQIPPEQKAYLKGELQSGNSDRMARVFQNPIYKMENIRTAMENLNSLSSDYLRYHKVLPLEKKIEFVGRSLINILDDEVEFDRVEKMVADLQSKNYFVPADALKMYSAVARSLRSNFVHHLICYGEKYSSKTK